jgi:hypothetical protein
MSVKIIHICQDEKFINSAIQQFEFSFPKSNSFYVVSHLPDFVHVKSEECVQHCNIEDLKAIAHTLDKSVLVVLHSLANTFYDFVLELPKENKVIWLCFGFEIYNDANFFKTKNLLDTITKNRFPEVKTLKKKKVKDLIRPYYRLLNKSLPLSSREYKVKVLKRIDFLGSSFQEEFEFISSLIKQKKHFFDFWYYPLEQILDVSAPINLNKKNILIGNSGSNSGNHLDVFAQLKKYNLTAEKIVVPLNYGESKYIDVVVNEGNNQFFQKFQPLLQFLSLQEYNVILEEVGIAVFNNRRQQAVGNTIALLWMGAKVFLSKHNPFYDFLKRKGLNVYCYEIDLNEQNCNQLLSLHQIEHNRSTLFNLLNREKLAVELQEQILKINV